MDSCNVHYLNDHCTLDSLRVWQRTGKESLISMKIEDVGLLQNAKGHGCSSNHPPLKVGLCFAHFEHQFEQGC
jgi:hypothetical protein